jgi:hypothetical protein
MADEIDRRIMPEFLQTTFSVSLGACFISFEMMKTPQDSFSKMVPQMKELFTIPSDAGDGLQKKAEAVAAVWMEKAATLVEDCKSAGEKFTEAK